MNVTLFGETTNKDKQEVIEKLIAQSSPRQDFFFMVLLAILMATFGVVLNNVTVIIGSMLIAPVLYPILSLAMGVVMSDEKLTSRSFATLLKSILLAISASAVVAAFAGDKSAGLEPSIFTEPSLLHSAIAITAGFAGAFALVKRQLNETLPGIAISASLVPPLAVVGIGIAWLDWTIVSDALILFVVNAFGIVLAGLLIFSAFNFHERRNIADKAIQKDEEELKNLHKEAEIKSR